MHTDTIIQVVMTSYGYDIVITPLARYLAVGGIALLALLLGIVYMWVSGARKY